MVADFADGDAGGRAWFAGDQAHAGDGDVVAGGLGGVHHGVGGADDGLHGVAVLGEGGEAEAAGEREGEALRR